MRKTTRKPLHKDASCRIYEDAQGMLRVKTKHEDFAPSPERYEGFTDRDFAELYVELRSSGISVTAASRWVNQAQGFQV